jgi:hypothetical protein
VWDLSLGFDHDELIFHLWGQIGQSSAPTHSTRVRDVIFRHGGNILLLKLVLLFADSKDNVITSAKKTLATTKSAC